MGAFYGSVHLRTDDARPVAVALAEVARRRKARFLIAQPRGGWVTVYPQDAGQDEKVAAAVARAVGGWAVWMSLHDDDVFSYAVWRDGRVVDRFNSCPEYFGGEVSAATRKRLAGNPARFAALLPPGTDAAEVKAGLTADAAGGAVLGVAFAARHQFVGFAWRLGLTGVETSYDDLEAGDAEGVEGWAEFVHVPDRSREVARRRRQEEAGAEQRQRWRDAGRLLAECVGRTPPRSAGIAGVAIPRFCADTGADGFLVVWSRHGQPSATAPVLRLAAPWSTGARETGVEVAASVYGLRVSPCGRWLAVGYAAGEWRVEVRAWPSGRVVGTVPVGRAADALVFAPDGGRLYALSEGRVTAIDPAAARLIWRADLPKAARALAVHPDGSTLVVDQPFGGMALLDAASGAVVRSLGPGDDSIARCVAATGRGLARQFAAAPGLSPGEVAGRVAGGVAIYEALTASLRQGEAIFGLSFAADGSRLLAASAHGTRGYDWPAVASAGREVPPPTLSVDALEHPMRFGTHSAVSQGPAHDAVESPADGHLLVGEAGGRLRSIDSADGSARTLVAMPAGGWVLGVAPSPDGAQVALGHVPAQVDRMRGPPDEVLVWDYARLPAE